MQLRYTTLLICFVAAVSCIAQDAQPPAWKLRGALAAWGDASPGVKAQALDQLRALKSLSAVNRLDVEGLLASKDAAARAAAIRALGDMGATDLRPRFLEIVDSFKKDPDSSDERKSDACAAVEALAAIEAPEATNIALDALRTEDIAGCMSGAGERAIERLKSADLVARLAMMIEGGGDHVGEAAYLIGKIGTVDEATLLMAHVGDKSNYTVNPFLTAVGQLKATNQIPKIKILLADKDDHIRAGAFEALGGMGDPALEPLIAKGLDDNNDEVKVASCEALGQLKAIQYASKIFTTSEGFHRGFGGGRCIRALGNMGATAYAPKIAARFLKNSGFEGIDRTKALRTLLTFRDVWSAASKRPRLLGRLCTSFATLL